MSRKNYKYDILLVATFKRKTYVTYGKVMDSYETLGGTSVPSPKPQINSNLQCPKSQSIPSRQVSVISIWVFGFIWDLVLGI
jgi:hypothetical protein